MAVLLYHIRYRFFFDFSDVPSPSWLAKSFYASTSFGHDAVIVFFVLSGFFIGTSVLSACSSQRFSWSNYVFDRITRLYVVLIPGLALTLFWDYLGLSLFGDHPIYAGGKGQVWANDYFSIASRLDFATLIGNLGFVQTIYVPPFGSNDPLWSLSYEFWYYMLFPALVLSLSGWQASRWQRVLSFGAVIVVMAIVSRSIVIYFPIWMFGCAVSVVPQSLLVRKHFKKWIFASVLVFVAAVVACHFGVVRGVMLNSVVVADYVTGLLFSIVLWVCLHDDRRVVGGVYRTICDWSADMSYTLYVAHMPLLVFIRAAMTSSSPWECSVQTIVLSGVIACGLVAYAWLVAWLTEARTTQAKQVVRMVLRRMPGMNRRSTPEVMPLGEMK
jgi:peptidoglycan/LPS O-acetylase OafA/YrhL